MILDLNYFLIEKHCPFVNATSELLNCKPSGALSKPTCNIYRTL